MPPAKRAPAKDVSPSAPLPETITGETQQQAQAGEMNFQAVSLNPDNLKFIPGPVMKRAEVLKAWCKTHCTAGWKMMPGGFSWLFDNAEDAAAFDRAWNSRVKPVAETAVTGELVV